MMMIIIIIIVIIIIIIIITKITTTTRTVLKSPQKTLFTVLTHSTSVDQHFDENKNTWRS